MTMVCLSIVVDAFVLCSLNIAPSCLVSCTPRVTGIEHASPRASSMLSFAVAFAAVPLSESSDCGPRCQLWREALEPQSNHERRLQEGLVLARPNPIARRELRGQAKQAGNSKVAQQVGNDPVPPKADPGLQDPKLWLAEARLRQHTMLCTPKSSPRCTPTNKWVKDLDPSSASLFQVGANIHQSTSVRTRV